MIKKIDSSSEVESLLDLYLGDRRRVEGRPWVMLNMISTVDGATAIDGRSSSIGGADDSEVFRAVRAVPDVILVGAGTVSAEDYQPVTLDDERREARTKLGMSEVPTLAIISGRLSIDPDARVFSNPEHKPMVITSTNASPAKLAMLGDAADVVILPSLEPPAVLQHLGAANVVLIEGGPTLNGQFAAAGLIDEVNLTVASKIASGDSRRIIQGDPVSPAQDMVVDRVLAGDKELFLRYVRRG
ncbi:MAG: dihydrofolate reductase family protein [Actinomycetota bacterium]|nr:dihydrofolate reductase family protein [Actinomycetota bacterium]